ncbi:MAG: dihydropteroate synthase [Gammaproteobacteria bacterium]|nr:dihydropteroate synthase [Gammaproteobacteria bacterium]|tara:strand:- start:24957 stop:26342 length:1386 start_codon:yes stop_codon:yes gene_type:complete
MDVKENILFITGKLAEKNLRRVLDQIEDKEFNFEIRNLSINVAALLTTDMIKRRIGNTQGFTKLILPGRVRGNIEDLSKKLNIEVLRGPDELKDLPTLFGRKSLDFDLSKYEISIFAEITDAPNLSVSEILDIATSYRNDGADVIDIGCLPNVKFNHLSETVQELKKHDFYVSVDSHDNDELITGGKSGADYLLSIKSDNMFILDEVESNPVLIPHNGDMNTLFNAIEKCIELKKTFIADPILDPIHFGFTKSISRYTQIRERYPDIHIMMGTGNITELTHADTTGITLMLLGIMSELKLNHVLTTQVSDHCRTVIKETDLARRIIHASNENNMTPKHISNQLLVTHEDTPYKYTYDEVIELSKNIRDPSYRIIVTKEGIHLFNRDGMHTFKDPFDFFQHLNVGKDTGHAFYLGVELARAQIAYQIGKFYSQDEELNWGCLVDNEEDDKMTFKPTGPTYKK